MGITAQQMIQTALSEVGYEEGRDPELALNDPAGDGWTNVNRYANEAPRLSVYQGQAYCCLGIAWAAWKSGDETAVPYTAFCVTAIKQYQEWNRWSWWPAVGAQVFMGDEGKDHTGLVISYNADQICTVEFNTNPQNWDPHVDYCKGVYLRVRNRRNSNVYGYGYPKYTDKIITADPTWKEEADGQALDLG